MEPRSIWLWGVTVANAAVACFLLLALYGIMLALSVIAPEISGWPLFIALPVGVVLSIIGLRFARGVASLIWRYVSYCLNGGILTLHLFIIFGLAFLFISSTKERYFSISNPRRLQGRRIRYLWRSGWRNGKQNALGSHLSHSKGWCAARARADDTHLDTN